MLDRYEKLQDQPIMLDYLLHVGDNPDYEKYHKNLMINSIFYNNYLSFGRIGIKPEKDFAEAYRIIKINNMIDYMLWDYKPPQGTGQQPELRGQLFTLPPVDAKERLSKIAEKNALDVKFLNIFFILKIFRKIY